MSNVRLTEAGAVAVLSNGIVRAEVDRERGTFSLSQEASGRRYLSDAAASVVTAGGPVITTRNQSLSLRAAREVAGLWGNGLAAEFAQQEARIVLEVTLYEGRPFVLLALRLENDSASPRAVQAFHVIDGAMVDLGGPPSGWKVYKEGWQNWTPAIVLPCSGEDLYWAPPVIGPSTQPPGRPGRFLAEMMATIKDAVSGCGLVAGFVTTARQFSQVWLDRDGPTLTAASYADGVQVAAGAHLESERLLVQLADDPLAGMQAYGDVLAREMDAKPWPHPVSGWCSWYYYWQGVTEEAVLANLEFLRWHRDELPVEYVQIDDGYQAGIGDWLTPNQKFPRGMKWLADQIHDRGFKAGLWLAPFMIGANSQLWKEHPDWAVQYSPGRPYVAMVNWSQECYAMDLTRPDVLQWLRQVFSTVFDDWGYDYVKIDFLYAGAVDGIRYDGTLTRAQAYRQAMELIRELAGGRFILGCGNPVGPSIGIVNGNRIGPDVAPFWYPAEPPREKGRNELSLVSTINGIRNIMGRFWMHDRLWLNDPDCMLARDAETALTLDEVRSLAAVISLSGGMLLDSDNLMRLPPERRALLSMMLPPYGRSAVPLDLFECDPPSLFNLDCGSHQLLGVFNWADTANEVEAPLPPGPAHVFDVWEETYLGIQQGGMRFLIPAHSCKLLALRPAEERPQLAGTSFHLLQGALEVESESWDPPALRLRLRPVAKCEGSLYFHVPPAWGTPRTEPGGLEVHSRPDGTLAVPLDIRRVRDLTLVFEPE